MGAGWTLEEVLDLSWDQLQICIRCVVRVKAEQARMALEALNTMLGGKPSKKKKRQAKRKEKQLNKDEDLMSQIQAAGIAVDTTETPRT